MWLRSSIESVCEGPDDEHGRDHVGGGEYESCGAVGINDDHRDHRERCQCAGDSDEHRAGAASPSIAARSESDADKGCDEGELWKPEDGDLFVSNRQSHVDRPRNGSDNGVDHGSNEPCGDPDLPDTW